jgi:hypothetical protein
MKKYRVFSTICFVLIGACVGLVAGFFIAARLMPLPSMPQSTRFAITNELISLNGKHGGDLEYLSFSETKWLSEKYKHWYYSLSDKEQNVVDFHDDWVKWSLCALGIGIALAVAGGVLQSKAKQMTRICDHAT